MSLDKPGFDSEVNPAAPLIGATGILNPATAKALRGFQNIRDSGVTARHQSRLFKSGYHDMLN